MSIKLKGSTDGSVTFTAPADTSPTGTDVTLTLPTSAGSAGQYLRNSGTAGTLEFGDLPASGKFKSYAVICDQKAINTSGGTFTSGAWQVRNLNTEITDPDGIVSIASNQFTLQAGTYLIKWHPPAYNCGRHVSRLVESGGTTVIGYGTAEYCENTKAVISRSIGLARVSITGATSYEIEHRCETTVTTYGLGVESTISPSIYTIVEIYKEV